MIALLKRSSFLLAAVIVMAVAAAYLSWTAMKVKAQPSSLAIQTTASATTTRSWLTAGTASTTYQFDSATFSSGKIANMQSVDAVSLFLQVEASSSGAWIIVTPQFSNNGIDWYGIGTATSTNNMLGTSTIAYQTQYWWNPGTVATTSMVFNLPLIPAQHERVVIGSSGGNAAIYEEVDLKKNPSNP